MTLQAIARLKLQVKADAEWDAAEKKGKKTCKDFLDLLKKSGAKFRPGTSANVGNVEGTITNYEDLGGVKFVTKLLPQAKKLGVVPEGPKMAPDSEGNFYFMAENGIEEGESQIHIDEDGYVFMLAIGNW